MMTVTVEKSSAKGTVAAPPSKSEIHRALICAALSEKSTVNNIAKNGDISATLSALESLGANISYEENSVTLGGLNPEKIPDGTVCDCGESGSTLRFLLPLCMLSGNEITLKGTEKLLSRPLSVYEKICTDEGIKFKNNGSSVTVAGRLNSGEYRVRGDISSQFVSGLLFALVYLDGESKIIIEGNLESSLYADMTVNALNAAGIAVRKENNIFIVPNSHYKNTKISVGTDYSGAAFLSAFNLIGGNVTVDGLEKKSLQPDSVYPRLFSELDAGKKHFDLSECPDLAPVMFALAAIKGGTVFEGIRRLRFKESDRVGAMREELKKFGIKTVEEENRLEIMGGTLSAPTEILSGHNDHRIVMAMSLLCSITGGKISGAEAVKKSFPEFFGVISKLGIGIKYET